MSVELPALPYAIEALEPHISRKTLTVHHGSHHAAYVDRTRALIKGTPLESASLVEIVKAQASQPGPLFNAAAQSWNHAFLWQSMRPNGGGDATGAIAQRIVKDFGSHDAFREQFQAAAVGQFASGWAWLVLDGGTLKITTTSNAATPLTGSQKPLLTLDVWEHAYYIDYRNLRPKFVETFLGKLANWHFAEQNFAG